MVQPSFPVRKAARVDDSQGTVVSVHLSRCRYWPSFTTLSKRYFCGTASEVRYTEQHRRSSTNFSIYVRIDADLSSDDKLLSINIILEEIFILLVFIMKMFSISRRNNIFRLSCLLLMVGTCFASLSQYNVAYSMYSGVSIIDWYSNHSFLVYQSRSVFNGGRISGQRYRRLLMYWLVTSHQSISVGLVCNAMKCIYYGQVSRLPYIG